jgi:hypothetical protein
VSDNDISGKFSESEKDEAKARFKIILRTLEASTVLRHLPTLDIPVLERLLFHISSLQLWPSVTRYFYEMAHWLSDYLTLLRFTVALASHWEPSVLVNLVSTVSSVWVSYYWQANGATLYQHRWEILTCALNVCCLH